MIILSVYALIGLVTLVGTATLLSASFDSFDDGGLGPAITFLCLVIWATLWPLYWVLMSWLCIRGAFEERERHEG